MTLFLVRSHCIALFEFHMNYSGYIKVVKLFFVSESILNLIVKILYIVLVMSRNFGVLIRWILSVTVRVSLDCMLNPNSAVSKLQCIS